MTDSRPVKNSTAPLRVLVADSAAMNSALLAHALHHEDQVETAIADSVQTLLEAAESGHFQVAVVGAAFHEDALQTLRLLRRLRRMHASLTIVVLLDMLDRDLVVQLFQAGVQGVFLRSDSVHDLAKCIQCVHRGEIWAASREVNLLVDALSEQALQCAKPQAAPALSRREEQVAILVAEGLSNRQISQRLQLSEHTIKNYLFRMFEKLGIETRVELALYSLEQRASLPLPPPS